MGTSFDSCFIMPICKRNLLHARGDFIPYYLIIAVCTYKKVFDTKDQELLQVTKGFQVFQEFIASDKYQHVISMST